MNDETDEALVRLVRQGRLDAYGSLVQKYQGSVFNVCFRLLGEKRDAEDLAQETFIRAYRRLDLFDASRPFGPWVRRIAANLCYTRLKRSLPADEELEDEWLTAGNELQIDNPAAIFEQNQQSRQVRAALLALPPHYRMVVELRHYQEMDYQEMAETLGLPLNTVRSHLFRARKLLFGLLHKEVTANVEV